MNFFLDLINKILYLNSRTILIAKEYQLNKSFRYVWGMKPSGLRFRNNSDKSKIIFIEDGFIHSYGYKKKKIPFSICYDKKGIFYNHKSDSELFKLIKEKLSKEKLLRSRKIIKLWKDYSISKYNFPNFIEPPDKKFILLIDQTLGDLSIYYGGACKDSFTKMFDFAYKNWPDHKILIKVHPDVIKSKKNGCIDETFFKKKNVIVVDELGQINKLIEFCSAVCVVTSQVGFESLIYEKEVHVFGKPFYSGLGLTIDHNIHSDSKNINSITIEQLVYGTLVKYHNYLDPKTYKACEVETILDYINKNRIISRFFPNDFEGINLTPWKARQINRFIYPATGKRVKNFISFKSRIENIIVWGKNQRTDKYISKVKNCISVEDGFIRSVGLGGDLFPPYSLLFDKKGIHFDGSRSSDLENLLQEMILEEHELIRSRKIIELIVKLNISKYNLKFKNKLEFPRNIKNRDIIAVLGQVENDNSILYGVPNDTIQKSNFSLVKQVKKDYPNSYIIYKPHPDIDSGLRAKGNKEKDIKEVADFIAYNTPLEYIFNKVDKVAVFTSLGGFEALIRGISVITYGFPFYAGWGLTLDKLNKHNWAKRRTRRLSLEELIFISLVKYPLYSSLKFDCFLEIENVIEEVINSNSTKRNLEQMIFKYWGILKDRILTLKN